MSKYNNENVLVIKRETFDQLGAFEGVSDDVERYMKAVLDPANNFFLSRDLAEDDPSHKQLIPYLLFQYQDRYLCYRRGGKSGDKRLVAKRSIGIGGHINDSDFEEDSLDSDVYHNGLEREIREELEIDGNFTHEVVSLLNDESNSVGQVHLGVVHEVQLDTDKVRPGEDSIEDIQFLTIEQLEGIRDELESWSQICLDEILKKG